MIETELDLIKVDQERTIPEVELRYEFLVISEDLHAPSEPAEAHIVEYTVRGASIALILDGQQVGGHLPDQIVQNYPRRRVVRQVHVGLVI